MVAVGAPAQAADDLDWLTADDPASATVAISQARFSADQAAFALLSRDDLPADALAGSVLTRDAPLLATSSHGLRAPVAEELSRVLPTGAPVVLLGGEQALAPAVADAVEDLGMESVRLSGDGATRVETARRVVEVARGDGVPAPLADVLAPVDGDALLLARAFPHRADPSGESGWVDAIAGGAYAAQAGVPLMLTPDDALDDAVVEALDGVAEVTVLGGTGAVPDEVEQGVAQRVGDVDRISGPTRIETADAIAEELWDAPATPTMVISGYDPDAWAAGLAGAGLAADRDLPLRLADRDGDYTGCTDRGWVPDTVLLVGDELAKASVRACGEDTSQLYALLYEGSSVPELRWCRPISVTVNETDAPAHARDALVDAVDALDAAWPLAVRFEGTTSRRSPDAETPPPGLQDGEVVVSWPEAWGAGSAAGYGGATAWFTPYGAEYRTGSVQMRQGFADADRELLTMVLLHELGHVMGLAHIDLEPHHLGRSQVMAPTHSGFDPLLTMQPGDRAGLETLAEMPCGSAGAASAPYATATTAEP